MKMIIIGAGAAGLMAAYELTRKNIEVIVLERENRIGGRIHTLIPDGFSQTIEAAAEFIHGELPLTLSLMKKAKLPVSKVSGHFYSFASGRLKSGFGDSTVWSLFYEKADALQRDQTLSEFLEENFPGKEHNSFRTEVIAMAQGLDLADPDNLSVFSIREEWASEDQQYRPHSGYVSLLQYLHNESAKGQYELHLNAKVSKIDWKPNAVRVHASDKIYEAEAVIITSSVGNMQARQLEFVHPIPHKLNLFHAIGFGNVIKIILEFDRAFWEERAEALGFLFTPQSITFWTQLEEHKPILTGWIGNSHVSEYQDKTDAEIIESALAALVPVFGDIRDIFKIGAVFTYDTDSASGGGYSYLKIESKKAIAELNRGIEDTIWFAGEALHPKGEIATVEAALQSGRSVARKISTLKQ
ncbi:flavin monoamine oxidase family protein [Flavobacterium silvaticum]|uniref:Tryptophan 2-monooxygenase n=1 Tax=Flavobacterium silvaticum TaxID=1852020 RepID=A0A972FN60_9FLAO|nr:NAD(P)/FAD-dependent oxidoreductase [Flavobacterium silvaticum]NMH28788.1 FAD-dependent oxidoreductase [Flavobacterium silvaticum]